MDKNDLVILVVNSTSKKVFGNLNLGTTSSAKLDFIDKSKLTSSLALGSIDTENNCSTSATIQSVGSFSNEDITNLEKIAKLDDALVMVQNKYKNPTIELADVSVSINMATFDSIKDQFSSLDDANVSEVTPQLYMLRDTKWDDVNQSSIQLFPPSAITYNNTEANETTPMNASSKYEEEEWDEGKILNQYRFYTPNKFPQGDWTLKIDGNDSIQGTFTFNGAFPTDDNNKFTIPLPKVKLNMNGTKISSITIQWYIYNTETNQFEEASENILNSLMKPEGSNIPYIGFDGDNHNATSTTWNGTYYFPNNEELESSGQKAEIGFLIGQIDYSLTFK